MVSNNINDLMAIEETLLKLREKYQFEFSMDELIKIEKYLKEIGFITNIYFESQIKFGKKIDTPDKNIFKEKMTEYKNKLNYGEIDIDTEKYLSFIEQIQKKPKR